MGVERKGKGCKILDLNSQMFALCWYGYCKLALTLALEIKVGPILCLPPEHQTPNCRC